MLLSELDLFKAANEEPGYVKSIPGVQRTLYKVWSGLTKFIRSALSKEQSAVISEFGKFLPTVPVRFIPSVSFLSLNKLIYKNPSEAPSTSLPPAFKEQTISYTSIAEVCEIDREAVILCLKELIHQMYCKITGGVTVVLHFRVGDLTVTKGWVEFGGVTHVKKPEGSAYMSVCTPRSGRYTAVSEAQSFHPSNPNPLHQGASLNLNNYYRGLKYKHDNSLLAPVAFYTGQIHPIFNFRSKYTRKQDCEQPISPEKLYKMHQEQIQEKKAREMQEKQKEIEDSYKTTQEFHKRMKTEKNVTNVAESALRKQYALANIGQAENKFRQKQTKEIEKKMETYNYFPFTHGDEVEARQKTLRLKLNSDLQHYLKNNETSPLSSGRDPIVAVPKFLQTSEYSNVRRTQNEHVEKVMKGALDTYHKELRTKEKEKIKLQREREKQAAIDQFYYKQLEIARIKEIEGNTHAITDQIEERHQKSLEEKQKKQELYETSLDIRNASPERIQQVKDVYQDHQKSLVKQMDENDKRVRESLNKERELDTKILNTVGEYINMEDTEAKLRNSYSKTLNKDIWLKQMDIKSLEKDVGKLL